MNLTRMRDNYLRIEIFKMIRKLMKMNSRKDRVTPVDSRHRPKLYRRTATITQRHETSRVSTIYLDLIDFPRKVAIANLVAFFQKNH